MAEPRFAGGMLMAAKKTAKKATAKKTVTKKAAKRTASAKSAAGRVVKSLKRALKKVTG